VSDTTGILIDVIKRGGFWWPRRPGHPGPALAIPSGARLRVALADPAVRPFADGICRNGTLVLDRFPDRAFDDAPAAVAAVRPAPGDPFTCVEFRVGERWLSADALRGSGAMPWDEADELALDIAIDAVREQIRDTGETLSRAEIVRKAADAVAVSPYFVDEARERLRWLRM
jgi:hypothetical protein